MAAGKYQRWLEPEGLVLLQGWARDGLTNEQIAKNMGISRETLNEWRKKYPVISDALKKGREVVDYEVENALMKRIFGYDWEEKTVERSEKDGVKTKIVTKHVPPDTAALIFYLKNRMPKKWKDKPIDEADEDALKKLREILGAIPSAF